MDKLYGAYGSNLNMNQMSRRCPGASVFGHAVLKDWQLCFKRSGSGAYLSIEEAPGIEVPIGVWEIDEAAEAALDRYEGYPRFYRKETLILSVVHDGLTEDQEVMIYVMNDDRPRGVPSLDYLETCRQGYEDFWFDQAILTDAALEAGMQLDSLISLDELSVCPQCGNRYNARPALSRRDNTTLICPRCGSREALTDMGLPEDEIQNILDHMYGKEENA